MGNVWETLKNKYASKETKILMLGLDAAGKTTILYRLKLGEVVTTIPTIGFMVESVKYKNVTFTSWDLGGRCPIRPLWRHYYQNTEAIILVVDSNDRDRISECRDELWRLLQEEQLKEAVILILANKKDLPNAMKESEVAEKLELQNIKDRTIHLQATFAGNGDGLYEALDWLQEALSQKELKKSLIKPVKELSGPEEKQKTHTWWSTLSHYFMPSQIKS